MSAARQMHRSTGRRAELLLSFVVWAEYGLPVEIANVRTVAANPPRGRTSPVLEFLAPRAMNNVVETGVLRIVEAWELTNAELKTHGRRTLGVSHPDYKHLKRIRNKLVAHRIENLAKTERHQSWYKRTYGTYDSVLTLIHRTANHVASKVSYLERAGLIFAQSVSANAVDEFTSKDIRALLTAIGTTGRA